MNPTQLFKNSFSAALTTKEDLIKQTRYLGLQNDEQRYKEVTPYLLYFWQDLHLPSLCVYGDERLTILKSTEQAVLELLDITHPGSWGMISLGQKAFWPYINCDIPKKVATCLPCIEKCNHPKSIFRNLIRNVKKFKPTLLLP